MNRRALAVITAGFLTVSIAYAVRYGYGVLLPEMVRSLAISKAQAGIIFSIYFVAYTACSPVLGVLADRFDVRIILSIFTALLAAGAFCMAWASSVLSACIFFALAGIGHSACWTPVVALVQRWVPNHRRGMALSMTTMGTGFGIAVWSLLLPVIVHIQDWQAGWMAMGGAGFCIAALNFILVRNRPSQAGAKGNPAPPGDRLKRLVSDYLALVHEKRLWFIGLSYLFVGFTVLVPYTFLSAYSVEELQVPYQVAGRFLAIIAISGMAGKLVLGILSDSLGRVRVMIACCALQGTGCLGMAWCEHLWALYAFTVVFGLGWGAVWPVYAAAAPDFFHPDSSGSVIGLWTVFLGVGSIISPVLCGWSIDATGTYTVAFSLGCIGAILAILFLLPVQNIASIDVSK